MSKKKYEKHFISKPLIKGDVDDVKYRIVCQGSDYDFGGFFKNYRLRWNCITQPESMMEPHTHDFDEIFHFFGADPHDISDFQATIEFSVGKEQEIHTIITPTIVYIPAGLVHAPINFKVIKKPIIFMNIHNATEFTYTNV